MASQPPRIFRLTSTKTALALVVPGHLQSEINSLRIIHDKAYRKWQPHINVIYPFVDPLHLDSAISALRNAIHNPQTSSVNINLDGAGVFKHRRNATIFLKPSEESEDSICRLRSTLVEALGCDDGDGTYDGIFKPHLTVGQAGLTGNGIERLIKQVEKLAGLTWEGSKLCVLQREASGEMKIIDQLSFANIKGGAVDGGISLRDTEWRQCFSFTPDDGWQQEPRISDISKEAQSATNEVKIISYNLMTQSFAPAFESRLQLIITAISSTKISSSPGVRILCLQEINDEMLPILLGEPSIRITFPYSTHAPTSLLPSDRNLVTLSSSPFTHLSLQFAERHKTSLIVSFNEYLLEVANIHLTSALSHEAVQAKLGQMETLTKFFINDPRTTGKEILVAGDFNLTTSSHTIETALSKNIITPKTARLIGMVVNTDIWDDAFTVSGSGSSEQNEELFEGEEGSTFDRLNNHLAAISKSPIDDRPQRYDRVLFRKGGSIVMGDYEVIGLATEHGCPSDHYGVCATLKMINTPKADLNSIILSPTLPKMSLSVIEDSTDVQQLIEDQLPSDEQRLQRQKAINLLEKTFTSNQKLTEILIVTLGSYLMNTYFAESDVDVLVIGGVVPQIFFDTAAKQLRTLGDGFKGVHVVNSLVSIIEVSVLGIKFDLQYSQAPELLNRYHSTTPTPNIESLVFNSTLISSLSPSSLRPLNTYRDTAYLLNTIPDLPSYQTAHRYLSLFLKRRGLYSAKFGYLGGIHLSLMLNRVVKLIRVNSDNNFSPATIIRTFVSYYSNFQFTDDMIIDPTLPLHKSISRTPRDSIFIPSIHVPTARRNVASSCTSLTAQTLTQEFILAAEKLREGDWACCVQPKAASITDFVEGFGAFVVVQVDVWDVNEIGRNKAREMIGAIESQFPRLMVALGRIGGLDGRAWPGRFGSVEGSDAQENGIQEQLTGYYLVGVSGRDEMDMQRKKLFAGKVITAVREFETSLQEMKELEAGNIWVSMKVEPKKKIMDMNLVSDERDWGANETADVSTPAVAGLDELTLDPQTPSVGPSLQSKSPQKSQSTSLRPAQDIISRINWDPALSADNFLIGYEDRFLGTKEIELGKWKSEATDEEFIPMHRIVWVRQNDLTGAEKVWDRKKKVDLIFGSGVAKGK